MHNYNVSVGVRLPCSLNLALSLRRFNRILLSLSLSVITCSCTIFHKKYTGSFSVLFSTFNMTHILHIINQKQIQIIFSFSIVYHLFVMCFHKNVILFLCSALILSLFTNANNAYIYTAIRYPKRRCHITEGFYAASPF